LRRYNSSDVVQELHITAGSRLRGYCPFAQIAYPFDSAKGSATSFIGNVICNYSIEEKNEN